MSTPASPCRTELVRLGDVTIESLVEGAGPAIVMLPSLGRDGYEDFDDVAARLAAAGFTVLRPQPRGIGTSLLAKGTWNPGIATALRSALRIMRFVCSSR